MNVIVQLYKDKSLRVKSNWMNFIVFIHSEKNCSKSIVRGIYFHNELSIRNLIGENEHKDECLL